MAQLTSSKIADLDFFTLVDTNSNIREVNKTKLMGIIAIQKKPQWISLTSAYIPDLHQSLS